MNFMVIGSIIQNDVGSVELFQNICATITETLMERQDDIIVCSPFEDSADYYIMKSYVRLKTTIDTNTNCFYYGPKYETVEAKFNSLELSDHINKKGVSFGEENKNNMWFFSQIRALEEADCIIAIGGKRGNTSKKILGMAQILNKRVISIPTLGGSAKDIFFRLEYDLNSPQFLNCNEKFSKAVFIRAIERLSTISGKNNINDKRVFISYPREKTNVADYVEMLLRRKNIIVFRDESDFVPGADIQAEIFQRLNDSNVFIVLWCKENACSPWCFDEFVYALDKTEKEEMQLLILTLDDTRMIHPRARSSISYPISSKSDIQVAINKIL